MRKRMAHLPNVDVLLWNIADSKILKHMPHFNNMGNLSDFSKRPLTYLSSWGVWRSGTYLPCGIHVQDIEKQVKNMFT